MNKPLITIVVPVYNVKEYLERCIDSIIIQTYQNFELLLIDDGSCDGSEVLCDIYNGKDNRIKVFHKKNGGLSDARNYGIDRAQGEFITFVDSDDWISENYLNVLYQNLIENSADISGCSFVYSYESKNIPQQPFTNRLRVWDSENALKAMLLLDNFTTSAWGLLYKRELFDDIRYPVGKYYEDLGTTYKLLDKAERIVNSSAVMYYYYQRKGSIQNEKYTIKQYDEVEFAQNLFDFISEKYPSIQYAAIERMVGVCFHLLLMMNNTDLKTNEAKKLLEIIKGNRWEIIREHKSSKKARVGCLLSYFGIRTVKVVYNLFGIKGKVGL